MSAVVAKSLTVSAPECPLCRQRGEVRFTGLEDSVWSVPGKWTYRECPTCKVLWIDPRPAPEYFSLIYPKDYLTHIEPADFFSPRPDFWDNLKFGIKLEVLRRAYGYTLNSSNTIARLIGAVATHIPGVKRRVGYTVRSLHAHKGRLLDVGCGNGEFLLTMSRLGWEVKGIEPDRVSATLARGAGLEVCEESVESVALEGNNFDAITLNHVIEHLSDPERTLRKLVSALRPNGVLVSISPNPLSNLARWFGGAWRGLEPPRHFVLPSPKALANMAERCGLEPIVWTTARSGNWMARESISISRFGNTKAYNGKYLPHLKAAACKVLTALNKHTGEEVVLVGRKS